MSDELNPNEFDDWLDVGPAPKKPKPSKATALDRPAQRKPESGKASAPPPPPIVEPQPRTSDDRLDREIVQQLGEIQKLLRYVRKDLFTIGLIHAFFVFTWCVVLAVMVFTSLISASQEQDQRELDRLKRQLDDQIQKLDK